MTHTTSRSNIRNALTARRLTLLASAAALAVAVCFAGPQYRAFAPAAWGSAAHAAELSRPAGFADLVAKVKPAVVSVRDPGIGIPNEDLPLVFERFRRARNVRDIGGTGVGLAGACQVVRQHEGTISVESTPGRGSTFTVRLPIEPPRRASPEASEHPA